jgi:serine protease Do
VDTGAYVVDAAPGGPAEDGGIQPGDVIVGFDGHDVTSSAQLGELIRSRKPGDQVPVEVATANGRATLTITLGVNPLPNS